jgi:hypothetical protein
LGAKQQVEKTVEAYDELLQSRRWRPRPYEARPYEAGRRQSGRRSK